MAIATEPVRTEARLRDVMISADSHAREPDDLWVQRLPATLRDQAPRFSARSSLHPGGGDPHQRIAEMARDGVSAEVLYPNHGLKLFGLDDAGLQEACFRVYNDWIIEYCQVNPERLIGVAAISVYDIDQAVKELERCAAAGLRGAMLWCVPHRDLPFRLPHYEPLWDAAQSLEMSINLHILTGHGYFKENVALPGVESYRGNVNYKLAEMQDSLFDFVFYGVLDRYPDLKLALVETEVGWIPFHLQQWDYYYNRFHAERPLPLNRLPSEAFRAQVYATFFDDPVGAQTFGQWGEDNLMWSSDYPHPNSKWPHSQELVVRDLADYTEGIRAKLLHANVSRLFRLDVSDIALQPV